jgi:hypothetical protein
VASVFDVALLPRHAAGYNATGKTQTTPLLLLPGGMRLWWALCVAGAHLGLAVGAMALVVRAMEASGDIGSHLAPDGPVLAKRTTRTHWSLASPW